VPRGKASANLSRPPRPAQQQEEEPAVHRRRFITASTATTVAAVLGIDQTPITGRLSMSDVNRVHERIGRMDAHVFSIGGGPLISVSTGYIARLREALDGCTYGDRVERALHGAISNLYASAGWACHDSGDPEQATLLHTASLQSALLTADPSATARAWSNLAMQARLEGRHREAVQITRAALDNRRARQDPHIATLLHARLAIGPARTAHRTGAARSLLAPEKAYDRVDASVPTPTWLSFLNPAELSGLAAIAHQTLGHYDRRGRHRPGPRPVPGADAPQPRVRLRATGRASDGPGRARAGHGHRLRHRRVLPRQPPHHRPASAGSAASSLLSPRCGINSTGRPATCAFLGAAPATSVSARSRSASRSMTRSANSHFFRSAWTHCSLLAQLLGERAQFSTANRDPLQIRTSPHPPHDP
jgi:hypothetical protein